MCLNTEDLPYVAKLAHLWEDPNSKGARIKLRANYKHERSTCMLLNYFELQAE